MPNSDLISRDAAIESLGECPYNWNDWPEEIQAVDDWESHKKALEDLPAVDAAPVRYGWWISHPTEPLWDVCSACGTGCKRRENDDGAEIQHCYQYCPWCGARMMDGGDNDEAD